MWRSTATSVRAAAANAAHVSIEHHFTGFSQACLVCIFTGDWRSLCDVDNRLLGNKSRCRRAAEAIMKAVEPSVRPNECIIDESWGGKKPSLTDADAGRSNISEEIILKADGCSSARKKYEYFMCSIAVYGVYLVLLCHELQ